ERGALPRTRPCADQEHGHAEGTSSRLGPGQPTGVSTMTPTIRARCSCPTSSTGRQYFRSRHVREAAGSLHHVPCAAAGVRGPTTTLLFSESRPCGMWSILSLVRQGPCSERGSVGWP